MPAAPAAATTAAAKAAPKRTTNTANASKEAASQPAGDTAEVATREAPAKKRGARKKASATKGADGAGNDTQAPAKKAKRSAEKKAPEASEAAPTAKAAPEVGADAPAFDLESDGGGKVSLESLRGKNVVLYFYPRDDTPGCTVEACGFRDASDELKAKGAVVLGVSRDTVAKHDKFKSKFNLNFPLLSDPDGEVISAYGSWGKKKFMGREFDGILRTTVLIDKDGKIAKVYPKVSPKTHATEVLRDLEAMG